MYGTSEEIQRKNQSINNQEGFEPKKLDSSTKRPKKINWTPAIKLIHNLNRHEASGPKKSKNNSKLIQHFNKLKAVNNRIVANKKRSEDFIIPDIEKSASRSIAGQTKARITLRFL